MRFDFTAIESFTAYREGRISARHLLEHPAYRAVRRHAGRYGRSFDAADIDAAAAGRPSPFYGLDHLPEHLHRVLGLVAVIRNQEQAWREGAEKALLRLFPEADLDVTVYPIVGYDMGIGLSGVACLNCNYDGYLNDPREFLFYAVHECVHVIYERLHAVPALRQVATAADWLAYFCLWLQNEGYAVYAPLGMRREAGALDERDYRVLVDKPQMDRLRRDALAALTELSSGRMLARERYLDLCFGASRITYRAGCDLVRLIEKTEGIAAVRRAFRLDGRNYVSAYGRLLAAGC